MDLVEQHKEIMDVLNKIEANTRATKEIAIETAKGLNMAINEAVEINNWNPIQIPNESNLESKIEAKEEAAQAQEPANEPEEPPKAS